MNAGEIMQELFLERILTIGAVFVGIIILVVVLAMVYARVGRKK